MLWPGRCSGSAAPSTGSSRTARTSSVSPTTSAIWKTRSPNHSALGTGRTSQRVDRIGTDPLTGSCAASSISKL